MSAPASHDAPVEMDEPRRFTYRAITVPAVGDHVNRPRVDADDMARWIALAHRIGYRVQHRAARHKPWLARAVGAIAGWITGERFECFDPRDRRIGLWSCHELAAEHAAGEAFFALQAAQLTVTAAHAFGIRMRAPREPGSDTLVPVEAEIVIRTGYVDAA